MKNNKEFRNKLLEQLYETVASFDNDTIEKMVQFTSYDEVEKILKMFSLTDEIEDLDKGEK